MNCLITINHNSFTGECAPTLAPSKPANEATTIQTAQHTNDPIHVLYDINDIVHFEDNDIVMRDARTNSHEHNKLDNFVGQLNNFDGIPKLDDIDVPVYSTVVTSDVNGAKSSNGNIVKEDKEACKCQHGGGCVNRVCLCPLGYAGDKCEITLDLKVSWI